MSSQKRRKDHRPMHVITLKINTTKEDRRSFNKAFHAVSHLHNVMVSRAKKCLIKLEHDHGYQVLLEQYRPLAKRAKAAEDKKGPELTGEEKALKESLSEKMKMMRLDIGLSNSAFQSYLKKCGAMYNKILSSQQVQREATRVWTSVEKYIFGDGKTVHFKKYRDFDTIGGKSNSNGIKFDKNNFTFEWMKETYHVQRPSGSTADYVYEALGSEISYCDLKRIMFPNGFHYYIQVVLRGPAPKKLQPGHKRIGIDPGGSTMAAVSDEKAFLFELAPDVDRYNKQIVVLQQEMDKSRRLSNPDKYNADGTINKDNHEKWVFSKSYLRKRDRVKYLYQKKSRYIKQSHEEKANKLIQEGIFFTTEEMSYAGLARRSKKKAERQDKISIVTKKNGTKKAIRKYKKKKRYGSSMNNRAPALFQRILKTKAELYGGSFDEVSTRDYKASQYDHSTDTYKKIPLSKRDKVIDGYTVQRDLYSAFLILNTDKTLKHPDRDRCFAAFKTFVDHQDKLLQDMKNDNISMPQCFGF